MTFIMIHDGWTGPGGRSGPILIIPSHRISRAGGPGSKGGPGGPVGPPVVHHFAGHPYMIAATQLLGIPTAIQCKEAVVQNMGSYSVPATTHTNEGYTY